jgi:hypothetical protein
VDGVVLTEDHNTHVIVLQVEGHALHTTVEAHQLTGLHTAQTVHLQEGGGRGQSV